MSLTDKPLNFSFALSYCSKINYKAIFIKKLVLMAHVEDFDIPECGMVSAN